MIGLVKAGVHIPAVKEWKWWRILKITWILWVAAVVTSLLTQTSDERMEIGQKLVIDPLTRLTQKIDLSYRESMNRDYPGYMPINHQSQDQQPETVE